MFIQLSRHWWWFALRGISAILFGLIASAWRGTTLNSFMLLFGGFALADGVIAILATLSNISGTNRWWIILHGLVSITAAIFTFIWTESAATILLYLVATWAAITGILELVEAKKLDRDVSNERLVRWSGLASIIFAMLIILLPQTGVLSIAQMTATFAILFGLLTMILSLNIRSLGKFARLVSDI
jgi:uncharacterized membrane protein HdeD (DUF308 family)